MKNTINLDIQLTWRRLKGDNNQDYKWGDSKSNFSDPSWKKTHLIYRWFRTSDNVTVVVGETRRSLNERINNYLNGGSNGAGALNKRVFREQQILSENGDSLMLEFIEEIQGYNLTKTSHRRLLEGVLSFYYKPYMQFATEIQ